MLFYLSSRIICSLTSFVYPAYASYKTLSQRPASETDLERWLQYWAVLGCVVGVEYVAEWLINWIPFYYFFKTLFLLYLALPQTRGSEFIYKVHLEPFFVQHEGSIDAALASFKNRLYTFVQEKLRVLWDNIAATMGQQQTQAQFNPVTGPASSAPPPSLADPLSGPAQIASSLWRNYGPAVLGGAAQFLRQSAATNALATPAATPAATPQSSVFFSPVQQPPARPVRSDTTQSVLERRRQLEAELAALPSVEDEASTSPGLGDRVISVSSFTSVPSRSELGTDVRSRNASGSDARERTASNAGGRFEEIEVPSDAEGSDGSSSNGPSTRPPAASRGSWFGWGSGGVPTAKGGYERVKSD